MRYRLRTLLILLAIAPPLLWFGWTKYTAWREAQQQEARRRELHEVWDALNREWLAESPPFTPQRQAAILRLQERSMELQRIKR